ncbi:MULTISPECIES: histidine kinase [unclassified Desulfovibrio]|uniref:histidine kinase n=1 Tax=unclassified Desulfovibrio TaxID=2593640 RepID=UPI0013EBEEF8|nr:MULTISPECIES: histidine kinase [unclassified Desulfovibrio]
MPAPSLPGVLLLCESEALGALDKRALREAGAAEVRVMTSGVAAARMLAGITPDKSGFSPEIIVCTQKLEDMDGEQFCAILRLHPRLLATPVLLILPNDSEAEQLKTLGSGASALLGRPYSVPALQQKLAALLAERPRLDQLRLAAQHTDTSAFDAALATYGVLLRPERQPEDYFRVGMRCLGENRWNHAISAFQRALRSAQIKGEAELGMAAAWKGKGDMPRFHAWLARAAETFVRARRWHRARTAYARLLQDDPAARSPFLAEAHRLIRENAYDEAAEALAQSLEVTPQAQDRFARICLTAQSPEAMLAALEAGLGKAMGESAGDALSQDIRESLNAFAKEREERQRQVAAERQRQLSRVMAARRGASAEGDGGAVEGAEAEAALGQDAGAEAATQAAASRRERPAASATPGKAAPAAGEMDADQSAEEDESAKTPPAPALRPLTEADATTSLFSGIPMLNELIAVIKLTWKLMRRTR